MLKETTYTSSFCSLRVLSLHLITFLQRYLYIYSILIIQKPRLISNTAVFI